MKKSSFLRILVLMMATLFLSGCDIVTELLGNLNPLVTISYFSEYGTCPKSKKVMKEYVLTEKDLPELEEDG